MPEEIIKPPKYRWKRFKRWLGDKCCEENIMPVLVTGFIVFLVLALGTLAYRETAPIGTDDKIHLKYMQTRCPDLTDYVKRALYDDGFITIAEFTFISKRYKKIVELENDLNNYLVSDRLENED